jgi:hypothetical protein
MKRFEWIHKAAEAGSSDALKTLSVTYIKLVAGLLLIMKSSAVLKAASQGNMDGMLGLAECYRAGLGCEIDLDKRLQWLVKAAESGNSDAQNTALVLQTWRRGALSNMGNLTVVLKSYEPIPMGC